jgi:hypothetical protein
MPARTALATLSLIAILGVGAVPAEASSTGTLRVTVTDPVKQPIPAWLICPTATNRGSKAIGHCATTNAKGQATLTHVRAGVVYIAWWVHGRPEVSDPKKFRIKAGRTNNVRWENAGS